VRFAAGDLRAMLPAMGKGAYDRIADVRDGLTRIERVVLYELHRARREFGERHVSTALLYGRVVEHVNIGVPEFQAVLQRLAGQPLVASRRRSAAARCRSVASRRRSAATR
jgi:hypothetical protein